MIDLSRQAIEDLRLILQKSDGLDFDSKLSDEELTEIGNLLLTFLAESLKVKITKPELSITRM